MKGIIRSVNLFTLVRETFLRFPIPVILSIFATAFSFLAIADFIKSTDLITRVLYLCDTGFFAITAFILFKENSKLDRAIFLKVTTIILSFLLLVIFIQSLENEALAFSVGILLTITYFPFLLLRNSDKAQCNFNSRLLANIFFTVIATVILFGGLSAIFASIKYLFQVDVPSKLYAYIWTFAGIFFAPIYFLSRLPKTFEDDFDINYPKGLRFILDYILSPLLLAYLVILYLYTLKIALGWSLPKGNVAYMVTSFGVIGTFTFVMLQPVSDKLNIFVELIKKYFYHIFSIPLILLIIGTYTRISSYGITEERFYLILVNIWFLICFSYFTVKNTPSLKVIPLSLSIVLIIFSFGPWGANNISALSQKNRLEKILAEEGLLVEGKIVKNDKIKLGFEKRKEITSIINYMTSSNKLIYLQGWFKADLNLPEGNRQTYYEQSSAKENVFKELGFSAVDYWDTEEGTIRKDDTLNFRLNKDDLLDSTLLDISGYNYFSQLEESTSRPQIDTIGKLIPEKYKGDTSKGYSTILDNKTNQFTVKSPSGRQVIFNMLDFIKKIELLSEGGKLEVVNHIMNKKHLSDVTLVQETDGLKVKIIITYLNGKSFTGESVKQYSIDYLEYLIFIKEAE